MANETAMSVAVPATTSIAQELSGDAKSIFCSVQGGDRKTMAKVYNAMNNPSHKVGDCINQVILVKDVLVEEIELANEETGELQAVPRVVLIDEKGEAYQAVSVGVFNSLKGLFQVFGPATWDDPLPILVKQVPTKNGSMLTLDVKFD